MERQLLGADIQHVERIYGIRGRHLPDLTCRILTKNKWSVNHKGTLGCFLGHLRAWEKIRDGNSEAGFILEDNAKLIGFGQILDLELPEQLDLLWCNARTCYPLSSVDNFRPVLPILPYVDSHGRSIGTDCYLLSRAGANKLINFVEVDSCFTHVDLRLMAYSLTKAEGKQISRHGKVAATVGALRATYPDDHKILALSYRDSITDRNDWPSLRASEDTLGAGKVY